MIATRRVTMRDFVIFQVKLALDGLKSVLVIQLSVLAIIADFFSGREAKPRHFYSVVRVSERFDQWLNLYGAVQRLEAGAIDDGLFGASESGSDSLLGQIEQMVRGGDEPKRPTATD
ncbi:MAG: hypothetical protein ABL963_12125 [Longimicrobiales bacterium]